MDDRCVGADLGVSQAHLAVVQPAGGARLLSPGERTNTTYIMMSTSKRLRILHIAPSFCVGGAEQMAGHLMVGLSESHDVAGAGLCPAADSSIEHRLKQADIPVSHLGKRPGSHPNLLVSLNLVLKEGQPRVVHTHLSVLRYALPGLLRR